MATYASISASETQSGQPITESLMTRLADNPLAIAEGDPTAPNIDPLKAMAQNSGSIIEELIDLTPGTGTSSSPYIVNFNITNPADQPFDRVLFTIVTSGTHINSGSNDKSIRYRVLLNGVETIPITIVATSPDNFSTVEYSALTLAERVTVPTGTVNVQVEIRMDTTSTYDLSYFATFIEGIWI